MTRIQDALTNCCSNCYTGLKEVGSATVNWGGKAVRATGNFLADSAQKVAEFTKPYFKSFSEFVRQHKETLIPAAVGLVAGTVLYALFKNVCCGSSNNSQQQPPVAVAT